MELSTTVESGAASPGNSVQATYTNPHGGLEKWFSVSAKSLHTSRKILSKYLNPPLKTLSSSGVIQDWRGLADYAGYSYLDVENFALNNDPTAALLDRWIGNGKVTVGDVVKGLLDLERYDILENEAITKLIGRSQYVYQVNVETEYIERIYFKSQVTGHYNR